MEQSKKILLNLNISNIYQVGKSNIEACMLNIVNHDLPSEIAEKTKNFLDFALDQNIPWRSKVILNSDEESYRENITLISVLMESLPFISSSQSFSIKNSLKKALDKSGLPINDLFQCNSDVINSLLSKGHHKIAQDLRELGLIYGNSDDEKNSITNNNPNFFILDTKYLENINTIGEWLLQTRANYETCTKHELSYINRIKQHYGKVDTEILNIVENPHLLSRDGVALFAKAVYSLSKEELENFNQIKFKKRFENYSIIYKAHGYKNLNDIYLRNKEINTDSKDFFEDFLISNNIQSLWIKKLHIAKHLLKYISPSWFSSSNNSLLIDNYILENSFINDNYNQKSEKLVNFFKLPVESLIVKNPEIIFKNNLSIKNQLPLTIFSVTKYEKKIFEEMFDFSLIKNINTKSEADLFLEKLYFLNHTKYINIVEKSIETSERSIFNEISNQSTEELCELAIKIYHKSPQVIELSSKKHLYFDSLKKMTIDSVNDFANLLSEHANTNILLFDMSKPEDIKKMKFAILSDNFRILLSKKQLFSWDQCIQMNIYKNISESIEILKINNQVQMIDDIFNQIEKTLDKIENYYSMLNEITENEDKNMHWGELRSIVVILEQRYLEKTIPINKNKNKTLKF